MNIRDEIIEILSEGVSMSPDETEMVYRHEVMLLEALFKDKMLARDQALIAALEAEKWHKGGKDPSTFVEAYNLHNQAIDKAIQLIESRGGENENT